MPRLSLHNPRNRNIAWQALAVVVTVAVMGWFTWNAIGNFNAKRLEFGTDFLSRATNIPIGEMLIEYEPGDSNLRAIAVGLLNTVVVAICGILLATLLGTALGIARLSSNRIAARLALVYVEFVRNVPLLAHLFIIYLALQKLPPLRSAASLGDWIYFSNRGVVVPKLESGAPAWTMAILGIALLLGMASLQQLRRTASHGPSRLRVPSGIGLVSTFGLAIYGVSQLTLSVPILSGRAFVGGHTISPELVALLLGLALYYAAFIAEIVRGGILSVPNGQWEAATALGFKRGLTLRLVVLPQALRLMIPSTTSQYLDLTKMTSLAIAIGYPDLVAVVNSIIADTGRAIESIAIIMLIFLVLNLAISAFMNWLNARVALGGRTK